ncbi:MAG TPA: ribonuclease R [candidate division Zixibacteria bacterium]|nr:ribonuclease R [candidate division Zixibacteria bacterium]
MKPEEIIEFVRDSAGRPLKIRELSKAMQIPPGRYPVFRKTVKELLGSGRLVTVKRGRIGLPEQLDVLVGEISITKAGVGFLLREGEEEDLMIAPHHLSTALDGDKVMVRREGKFRGRQAGSVIKVIERARTSLVGVFHKTPHFNFVAPDNRRVHRDVYIPDSATLEAKQGQKVVVELDIWDDPYRNPEGRIVEVLGRPGTPRVDLLSIVRSFDLTEEFPREVKRQAEAAARLMTAEEIARREDFRDRVVYTIDPADAKDHDDAIHVERLEHGYRLGVHIADVSFFVREDTLLDEEALERGNSVYLPGKVIPMLPEELSNDMCSLRPHVDRLAQSVIIDFDNFGVAQAWRVTDSVIRSQAKLSYEDAQSIFDGAPANKKIEKYSEHLALALELAKKLQQRRFELGSLDFDLPEPRIELDASGEVINLSLRVRLDSHRLIEEFMLAANRAVALTVSRAGQPMLYRVHDRPDVEKLEAFAELAAACGHSFAVSDTVSPKMVQKFLIAIKDTPEEEYLNELALRSMKKAVYQPDNIGHFGLAFKHYTHFTSPIRRYPDLVVHRMLRKLENGRYPHKYAKKLTETLPQIGEHCSRTEREAERAEREAVKMMQATFLAKHLGMEFDGVISGVVRRGFFVRLTGLNAEGMVRISAVDDDFYEFDEAAHRMVGTRKRRVFRLGDVVRVGIVSVDIDLREVDLQLVTHTPSKTRQKGSIVKPNVAKAPAQPRAARRGARAGARGGRRK